MTETIINLETVNPIEFFGVNNGKLDLLKKKFPLLKILSRGTQIKLSGAPEQIETAKEKIEMLSITTFPEIVEQIFGTTLQIKSIKSLVLSIQGFNVKENFKIL